MLLHNFQVFEIVITDMEKHIDRPSE